MAVTERINYTGRIDLQQHEVDATYRVENDQINLTISWMLGHYGLSPRCQLSVELDAPGQTMELTRIPIGDLGDGNGSQSFQIKARNPEFMRLRLIVTEVSPNKIPLLKADGDFRPVNLSESTRSRSFLKIVKDPELTVPWRVDFIDDEPFLRVTDREDLFSDLRDNSKLFLPSVLPEVVRQVFEWLATSDVDRGNKTVKQWIKYFVGLTCPSNYFDTTRSRGNEEEYSDVINKAKAISEEFAKKYKINRTIRESFEVEGDNK
jgi:hypothetical protein